MHIAQPFKSMRGQALRLVAEHHDDMPLAQRFVTRRQAKDETIAWLLWYNQT